MSSAKEFSDTLKQFSVIITSRTQGAFMETCTEVHKSIQVGSPITGAPGQPVDTGALRNSWQLVFESPTRAVVGSNLKYAEPIEDGIGPHGSLTLRSAVGGFHSVKMTIAGIPKIVGAVAARLRNAR